MSQLSLFDPPPGVLWVVPVDRYGRDLPPIAIIGADWKPMLAWSTVAAGEAERLGPDATLAELYEATTAARHLYYALTGDRTRLELELRKHRGDQP